MFQYALVLRLQQANHLKGIRRPPFHKVAAMHNYPRTRLQYQSVGTHAPREFEMAHLMRFIYFTPEDATSTVMRLGFRAEGDICPRLATRAG
jgi:hypothetical protein